MSTITHDMGWIIHKQICLYNIFKGLPISEKLFCTMFVLLFVQSSKRCMNIMSTKPCIASWSPFLQQIKPKLWILNTLHKQETPPPWNSMLPLIDKGEFAIHGITCDELCGFNSDFSVYLGRWVGVDASHSHQTAEVGAILLICVTLPLCSQLTGWPAAHIACTVNCAVLLWLCRHKSQNTHIKHKCVPLHQYVS